MHHQPHNSMRKQGETGHSDLLDILITISEENGDKMDKSKMKQLFLVSNVLFYASFILNLFLYYLLNGLGT